MSTFLSPHLSHPLLYPYPYSSPTTRTHKSPFFHRFSNPKPTNSAPLVVAKFGLLNSSQLPDPESVKELFGRAESILYTLADAAVNNTDVVDASNTVSKQNGDWLSGITSSMESILKVLKDGLTSVHVPYSYGFAIILLTILVKAATFPLSKKQVESAMAMRSLQPQIKAIQKRYAGDQERIQLETARLYKLAGINPLAGCLPTLATIPVWIGLYRALSNVANEGLLTEGFFWIPSLAGPTTVASRASGSGISWLFPFVDGHPPLGWSDTAAYLVLPVLLIVSQYISIQIMQSSQPDDPNLKSSQAITKFLPLMIGYFSLSVPSGLSLYWFTNNILSTLQQVWLQKMSGAKNPVGQISGDLLKEEQPQPAKTVYEAKSIQAEVDIPSTGPRPGDRFKKLKEEEARRKRQSEEENMKTEVKQDNLVGPTNGSVSELVNGRNTDQSTTSVSATSNSGVAANGEVNGLPSKNQLDVSDQTNANGRPKSDIIDGDAKENLGSG
ncbi:inner membrane protein PPF-1, chloroplastic-like isoform X2 [Silene latifolia]|uniref:inner membrane protein PPF-1, chloroplastic-like isoform X2 n=1 Tax=Silene latifolia TaxID=37657 RepID=UPI003D7823D2